MVSGRDDMTRSAVHPLTQLVVANIQRLREEKDLSIQELARLAGRAPSGTSFSLRGYRGITMAALADYAAALEVRPPYLLEDHKEPPCSNCNNQPAAEQACLRCWRRGLMRPIALAVDERFLILA